MRVSGILDLDGSTVKLKQAGNSTTITEDSPSSDITLTLPKDADAGLVASEHGGDTTKLAKIDTSGATTAKTITISTSHTDDRVITMPDATDTLVGKATTDTLTNKTLTSPVLTAPQINDTSADHQYIVAVSELAADRTITLPLLTGDDEVVFKDHTQTLTNKTLTTPTINVLDNAFSVKDNSDATKIMQFELSGITTSTTRTLTVPDASTTLVGTDTTQTLSSKTLTAPIVSTTLTMDDQAEIRFEDDTGNEYVAIQASTGTTTHTYNLPTTQGDAGEILSNDGSGNLSWVMGLSDALNENHLFVGDNTNTSTAVDTSLVGDITADSVTGLTINSGVQLTLPQINDTSSDHQYIFAVSELTADRTITLPLLTGNDEFVFKDHTQTLTNKSLTSPTITTATMSGDTAFDTDTLFIDAANNEVGIGTTTPGGKLHIKTGTSSATPQGAADDLILEGSGNIGMSIITGTTNSCNIAFGDSDDSDIGLISYSNSSDSLSLTSGGNVAINSSLYTTSGGDVGVGESVPLGKLHVKTADSSSSVSTSADDLIVENSGITGMTLMSGTTSSGNIFFADSGATAQGRVTYDHNSDSMSLIVDDSDTVTIDSAADGARLGINESSPAGTLHVKAGTNGLYNIRCEGFNQGASANNNMMGFVGSNGAITGEIAESAGVLSLNDSSDARLKENIKSFDALDLISTAKPVKYNRIGQSEQEYGFIAQELYKSIPQFVKVGGEDVYEQPWTVSYGRMSPVLMRAIQQLAEKNQELEDRITALEN